jgi:hypothetical protein
LAQCWSIAAVLEDSGSSVTLVPALVVVGSENRVTEVVDGGAVDWTELDTIAFVVPEVVVTKRVQFVPFPLVETKEELMQLQRSWSTKFQVPMQAVLLPHLLRQVLTSINNICITNHDHMIYRTWALDDVEDQNITSASNEIKRRQASLCQDAANVLCVVVVEVDGCRGGH